MSWELLGKTVVSHMQEELEERVRDLRLRGIIPKLLILRVGDKDDDLAYERSAIRRCQTVAVESETRRFPETVTEEDLLEEIDTINRDPSIHACLLFRPLPNHIDELKICNALAAEKDVDGISAVSMAGIYSGIKEGFPPCTAQACLELLDFYDIDLQGKNITVIGRSLVIGKPIAMLLLARHATVKICHSRTIDLPGESRSADIIIAAAGQAGIVDARFLSENQIVIDVGVNVDASGQLRGDVKTAEAAPLVHAYTPVPGGVGPVTTAVLVKHVVEAAERQHSPVNHP